MSILARSIAFAAMSFVGFQSAYAQESLSVSSIADDLADVASFVQTRSIFEGDREVRVAGGEELAIAQRVLSTQTLSLAEGARIVVGPFGKDVQEDGIYIVTKNLVLPTGGEPPIITWAGRNAPDIPSEIGRAESGLDGRGTGQPGSTGQGGSPGNRGMDGVDAPILTIVVMQLEGSNLLIDLSGGAGGHGGRGQDGGHGGDGANGNPARNAMVNVFGAKTAVGCAAGPGRGGIGGDGGSGGVGGSGGNGGSGGIVRVVAPADVADSFFESVSIDVLGGNGGPGGAGGRGGSPGSGGLEGTRTSFCGSASRNGISGRAGSEGTSGPDGEVGLAGRLELIELSESQLAAAFNF